MNSTMKQLLLKVRDKVEKADDSRQLDGVFLELGRLQSTAVEKLKELKAKENDESSKGT